MANTRRVLRDLKKSSEVKKINKTKKNNKKSTAKKLQSNENKSIPSIDELLRLCTPLTVRLTPCNEASNNESK